MFEEFSSFHCEQGRVPPDWKSELRPWADWVAARAEALTGCSPEGHGEFLLETARELVQFLAPEAEPATLGQRAAIALLCAQLRVAASELHEKVLPAHASEAVGAAKDIDDASVQMLLRMDGDYGVQQPA